MGSSYRVEESYSAVQLLAAGLTDVGRGRVHNEDTVLVRTELGLYLLADGAGGHNAGNVASALAATSIANYLEKSLSLEEPEMDRFGLYTKARKLACAIQHANREIIEVARSSSKYMGMGTTAVAALFSPGAGLVHIAHVGDSRCYRLRGATLEQLTHDHSLLNDVLEMRPDAGDDVLDRLPRNVVTRALGMEDPVRVTVRTFEALPGDKYLLCSDGLTDELSSEQIADTLIDVEPSEKLARALVDRALGTNESTDNIGVVVVSCEAATAVRARIPAPPPVPEFRGTMGSAPEIVILGVETHVVPADAATPPMLDALGTFAGALKRRN
jgi:protein phosphatase